MCRPGAELLRPKRRPGRDGAGGTSADDLAACARPTGVRRAGSPSYALAAVAGRVRADASRPGGRGHGVTVLARPRGDSRRGHGAVYEIYKVGVAPQWLTGLDLLGVLASTSR